MKNFKRVLSVLLAIVMIVGTAELGFSGLMSMKASATMEDPTALGGMLKVNSNGDFKILQVADLQDHAEADGKTNFEFRSINMIKIAVARLKPDLIVLTGDNIYQHTNSHDRDDKYIKDDFLYSAQIVVDAFDGTPFAVTYGNHDVERNDGLTLKAQQEIYDKLGAVKLCQDGLTITDTSDNSTSKYGTGYIDVYSNDGSKVVERVIILNSGTYENSVGYDGVGFGRPGLNATTYQNYDYNNIVNAVNKWTSNPEIKCIGYQHIQLREMFDADTPLLIQGGTVNSNTTKKFYPPSYGKTWQPNPAANPTGEYLEPCGCSGASTRELFNAYAKSNVVGVFFGHDHSNTVCGTVTAGGRSLYMGYGGGMDMYSDYAEDLPNGWGYDPRTSLYTVNANGTLTKDNLTYYGLLRNWSYDEYGSDQTYISEVRLFASDITISGNVRFSQDAFNDAVNKCLNAGYIPLETAYNRNKDTNGNGSYSVSGFPAGVYYKGLSADFNFDCYHYDTPTTGKTVVLGYKTTNNPREAITDIRIGQSTSGKNSATITQKLSATVNNASSDSSVMSTYSCGHGINPSTSGTQSVTYYNANYNWTWNGTTGTSQGVRADGLVKFNQGLDYAGDTWDTYLFYTKDPVAGLPVSRVFADITGEHYSSSSTTRPELTFNKNRYPQEYPYTWTQAFSSDVDYDRNNLAFNVKCGCGYDDFYFKADNQDASDIGVGYTYHVHGNSSKVERSASAHIGLVRALPTGKSMTITKATGGATTQTGPTIIVPDTIYLAPNSTSVAGFYDNNSSGAAVSGGLSDTAHYYFSGTGCTLTDVSVSGATLNINKTNQTISKTSSSCSGVSAGGTKTVEWTFTYTQNGSTKTAKAYTTVYSPCTKTVGAANISDRSTATSSIYTRYSSCISIIYGVHGITKNCYGAALFAGSSKLIDSKNYDSYGVYNTYPIINSTYTLPTFRKANERNNLLVSNTGDSNGHDGVTVGYAGARVECQTVGGEGYVYFDSDRQQKYGDLPYFNVGVDYLNIDTTKNCEKNATYYIISGSPSSSNTLVKSYRYKSGGSNNSEIVRIGVNSNTVNDNDKLSEQSIANGQTVISYGFWQASNNLANGKNYVACLCTVTEVSKASLREKVQEAVIKQKVNDAAYMGVLSDASEVLGNPAASQNDVNVAITSLENAINGVFVDYSKITVNYKSSSGKVLDTVKQGCFYNDTVTAQVRNYNGYTAPSAPAAWTASAATKTFDLTYTRNNYTITFNSAGGSSVSSINYNIEQTLAYSSSQTISNQLGGNITIPAAPTLSGHTFKGWKVAEASANSNWLKGTIYQPGDVTGYKYGNVTLVAVWDKCELKIDSNNGKTQNNLVYFANGASSASVASSSHTFGASYESDGDIAISGFTTGTGENTITTTGLCVYLEKGKQYKITFNCGANADFFITNNNMGGGSYTGRLYNGNIFTAGSKVSGDTDSGEHSLTDSAATTGVYTLRLDVRGVNTEYALTNLRIVEVSPDTGVDNVILQESGSERIIQNPVRDGYTFKGWYTAASGGSAAPNMVNNNNGTYTYKYLNASQTIYAQWTPITYTVAYNGNGATSGSTASSSHTYDVAKNLTDNGFAKSVTVTFDATTNGGSCSTTSLTSSYQFLGWANSATGDKVYDNSQSVTNLASTQGATVNLYAKWGTTLSAVTLPTPNARTGYTFNGWYTAASGGTKAGNAGASYTPTGAIKLYAQWTINTSTLKIDPNGGTWNGSASVQSFTQNYNTTKSIPNPTRDGYTFGGWTKSSSFNGALSSTTYTFGSANGVTDTLTANWTVNQYTVTFDNKGHGTAPASQTVNYNAKATNPGNLSETGYTFGGWYADSGCTTAWNFDTAITENTTIYAKWTINQFTVTFNANGHGTAPAQQTVNYNATATQPAAPTDEHFFFVGWYKETACTNVWNFATDKVTDNTTLYAKWVQPAVNDTYVLDSGNAVNLNVLVNDLSGAKLTGVEKDKGAELVYDGSTATKIKFTPSGIMSSVVTISYTVSYESKTFTATVNIVPATTVYYEESSDFITFTNSTTATWSDAGTAVTNIVRDARAAGEAQDSAYGSNDIYTCSDKNASTAQYSLGNAKKVRIPKANNNSGGACNVQFTFTGTGFEVNTVLSAAVGNVKYTVEKLVNGEFTGAINYTVSLANGYQYAALYKVGNDWSHSSTGGTALYTDGTTEIRLHGRTYYTDGTTPAMGWLPYSDVTQVKAIYQAPAIYQRGLDYGTYRITIIPRYGKNDDVDKDDFCDFYFDSLKIYDPIDPKTDNADVIDAYKADKEYDAKYENIRGILVTNKTLTSGIEIGDGKYAGIAFLGSKYVGDKAGIVTSEITDALAEYQVSGPKNEVYLAPGDTIAFKVEASTPPAKLSLGMKLAYAYDSAAGQITVQGDTKSRTIETTVPTEKYVNINDTVASPWSQVNGKYVATVIISNTGTVPVSLTEIRYSYSDGTNSSQNTASLMTVNAEQPRQLTFYFDEEVLELAALQSKDDILVDYKDASFAWDKSEIELGETATLTVDCPEIITKISVGGEDITNYIETENGKAFTYSVTPEEAGSYSYKVVLFDENGYNSDEISAPALKVNEPKIDISDAQMTWDADTVKLGETATLAINTCADIKAVIVGGVEYSSFTEGEDGRRTFTFTVTPNAIGKYSYTVALQEKYGYTSTNFYAPLLTVASYVVSTDGVAISWNSNEVVVGEDAVLTVKTPANIAKVTVDGQAITDITDNGDGTKTFTFTVKAESEGKLEYAVRLTDENGMISETVSSGTVTVKAPATEDPGTDEPAQPEKLTFWQKIVKFFKTCFSTISNFFKEVF